MQFLFLHLPLLPPSPCVHLFIYFTDDFRLSGPDGSAAMEHLIRAPIQTGRDASCPLVSYHPHVWVLPPCLHYLISSPIYLFIKSSDRAARHTHTHAAPRLSLLFGFHELAAGRMFLLEMLLPLSFSRDLGLFS